MALVKILSANLFAGASFQKLEAGVVYDVDDAIAEKWLAEGKAEKTTEKKGEKLSFAVAAPSTSTSSSASELQTQLKAALAEVQVLKDAAEAATTTHAAELEAVQKAHATALEIEKQRADAAEAALAEIQKKAK
ncbi:hypothetical protein [Pantoea coffeiphila]|uniref:hypothetical protein n=1 Tax=Pantoea coffeiphila TaxID=1465635 RepID=UPI001961E37E|nr:hypothetical protein [Pantoea coffeiphila]MBM7346060.1 hypothetical protein [Pantoea coffeiphila]